MFTLPSSSFIAMYVSIVSMMSVGMIFIYYIVSIAVDMNCENYVDDAVMFHRSCIRYKR